jgi:S1-C subfamily serine protease
MFKQDIQFRRRLSWIIIGIVIILAVIQLLPWIKHRLIGLTSEPRSVTARGVLAEDEKNTIEIFARASPSVVYINTRQQVIDPWTRDVYSVSKGTGSGFIWDRLGHVVTNQHVIENASEAIVHLNDGRSYQAVLVGNSPSHDLVVLRISVPFNAPPPVPIGTSHDLKVGQKVFAIGNPFGLDYTLTTGIVSALDRTLRAENDVLIKQLIQTDAAINPGNSGGPLLDSAGRLIGINTAIYSSSGSNAGIGFAVPVDIVNRVVPELIAHGKYKRPTLGITVDNDLNTIITEKLDIKGVMVITTEPGSGAEKAGLRETRLDSRRNIIPGDIILSVDGHEVEDVSSLLAILEEYQIGDRVKLKVWRNRDVIEVEVGLHSSQ